MTLLKKSRRCSTRGCRTMVPRILRRAGVTKCNRHETAV